METSRSVCGGRLLNFNVGTAGSKTLQKLEKIRGGSGQKSCQMQGSAKKGNFEEKVGEGEVKITEGGGRRTEDYSTGKAVIKTKEQRKIIFNGLKARGRSRVRKV